MSVSPSQFWQLLGDSRLLAAGQCHEHEQAFARIKGAGRLDSARTLAEWLISQGALTRHQTAVLLAGRSGPFLFDDYKIYDRFDSGRFAGRFRAIHVPSGHPVMLDFLSGPIAQNQALWAAAARAAEAARRIVYPRVSRFYELVDLVRYKFAAVEDLEGQSLKQLLAAGHGLPPAEACRVAWLAAQGLAHLGRCGQVHGEVRPANIWIEPEAGVKLLGVPLSHDLVTPPGRWAASGPNAHERQLEAADYLAPELAGFNVQVPATWLGDVYALGCVLYEMLAGRAPFAGGSAAEKFQRHAGGAIQPLEAFGVPEPVSRLVNDMLAKNPDERRQRTESLVERLAALAGQTGSNAVQPRTSATLATYERLLDERRTALTESVGEPQPLPQVEEWIRVSPSATRPVPAAPASDRRPPTSSKRAPSTGAVIGWSAAALMALVAAVIFFGRSPTPPEIPDRERVAVRPTDTPHVPPAERVKTIPTPKPPVTPAVNPRGPAEGETAIEDDGQTLWASPTSGTPIELAYLPPGVQVFLVLRPAELLAHEESEKLLFALGPAGSRYLALLNDITGFDAQQIEQLVVGIQARGEDAAEASLVVRLAEPATADELADKWNRPPSTTYAGKTYYTAGNRAYYIPVEETTRIFAVTSAANIRELIDAGRSRPLMSRDMETLLAGTDAARHVTLLFTPHYLFGDGKALLSGATARLRKPLFGLLGDNSIKAVVMSFHLADNFFGEMRCRTDIDVPPAEMAGKLESRLAGVPDQLEQHIASMDAHPYGRQVLLRFPAMVRFLTRHTRIASETGEVVIRTYQPPIAAHNLMLGAELALSEQGLGGGPARVDRPSSTAAPVAERLEKKVSLSFPRDTLEVALKLLAEEVGVEIVILGGDLQLDGITKNQSFGIDMRDQPAGKILEQILVLANPDKTAQSPSDAKQKLLYVIKPKSPGGEEAVFVTTREQAKKRGDKLPPAFAAPEVGKK